MHLIVAAATLLGGCSDQVIAKRQYPPEVTILSPLEGT
jgi:hypothetical protein